MQSMKVKSNDAYVEEQEKVKSSLVGVSNNQLTVTEFTIQILLQVCSARFIA